MKTKYKKVPVSERLPKEETWQFFNSKTKCNLFLEYYVENKKEMILNLTDYWLEEVPDMEDEMREMLDKAVQYLSECDWHPSHVETYSNFTMNANEFLTKLKTKES
ncbi:hypothetical protein [Chryseobacterium bernardetii]|uniref:hypothetical protein n=1 Tax=Chryseobacterium bernardetii TaxID=1241978 RepID=UPI0016273D87|nr:hypothetical protein [Chryseobacterium bernardetii]